MADSTKKIRNPQQALGALKRYRVAAWITGVMLLALVVEMILVYVVQIPDDAKAYIAWIPFVHGIIYMVYLVTVLDAWSRLRWGFGRLVVLVLAGVVPVLSFIAEHKYFNEGVAQVGAAQNEH